MAVIKCGGTGVSDRASVLAAQSGPPEGRLGHGRYVGQTIYRPAWNATATAAAAAAERGKPSIHQTALPVCLSVYRCVCVGVANDISRAMSIQS